MATLSQEDDFTSESTNNGQLVVSATTGRLQTVCICSKDGESITGVSDDVDGAWTVVAGPTNPWAIAYKKASTTGNRTISVQIADTGRLRYSYQEWAGTWGATPLEDSDTNLNTNTTSHSHGSVTSPGAGVIIAHGGGVGDVGPATGFSALTHVADAGYAQYRLGGATTTSAVTGSSEAGDSELLIAAFTEAGGSSRTVDSISDATLTHGQTGVVVGVTGYAASGKTVKICPTDDVDDAAGVAQTVTAQDASSVTFTAVLNSFTIGATLYLFVLDGGVAADSNADGEAVSRIVASATLNFTGSNKFINEDGSAAASVSGMTMYVWRSPRPPGSGGAPDQIITSVATNGSGELSQGINVGALDDGDSIFYVLFAADGTDRFSAGEKVPTYA